MSVSAKQRWRTVRRSRGTRRGLTLLEVLASAVLLALVVAACASVLKSTSPALAQRPSGPALDELAALADALLKDPESFGIDEPLHEAAGRGLELFWDREGTPGHVKHVGRADPGGVVRVQVRHTPEAGHAWLILTYGDSAVSRWLPVQDDQEPGGRTR